jgi:hypothetical protein
MSSQGTALMSDEATHTPWLVRCATFGSCKVTRRGSRSDAAVMKDFATRWWRSAPRRSVVDLRALRRVDGKSTSRRGLAARNSICMPRPWRMPTPFLCPQHAHAAMIICRVGNM